MNGSTKLVIALILIFATCCLALSIAVVYVLWRKRMFRERSVVNGGGRSVDSELSNSPFYASPSKELLYFFCWKNQPSRVEPSSAVIYPSPNETATAPDLEAATEDAEDDEPAKWQALYGPSRVLYTIKEEEREVGDNVEHSANQSEADGGKRVSLRDSFSGPAEMVDDSLAEEATPFSTPCASPPYLTPSPSPGREVRILMSSPDYDDVNSPGIDVLTDIEIGLANLQSDSLINDR